MRNKIDLQWTLRSQDSIAQNALTNSKRPECFVKGVFPTHISRAIGPFVWDTSRNKYIDFICGLGSNILGYANNSVNAAIYQQMINGTTYSLSSELEVLLAEKMKEIVPFIERVKFLKTGTEACLAAIRIARAKTGRSTVLSHGYHGWGDPFVSLTPPALGISSQTGISPFKLLEDINGETAAVIIEPILCDLSERRIDELQALRRKCTQEGALLIFDEVITGFRFPKFSVSNHLNIQPDLIVMGKAMGNGMPISFVGGSKDIMNCGEYFVSSTFAGETLSIAASLKVIELLQTKKYNLEVLWERGQYFKDKFNSMCPENLKLTGYPTRGVFEGDLTTKALFWQESVKAGILFGSSWFINFSHLPYIDNVLNVLQDILTRIKTGSVELEGELPQSPFAQKARQ